MEEKNLVFKTIKLYANSGWKKWFAYIRFWDAPYCQVEKIIPKRGMILELGCGEGVFSNFIALSQQKRRIVGVEIDRNRVNAADRGLKNATFIEGDVTTYSFPRPDVIVMMHLLHHLNSYKDQQVLIERCSSALKKGGMLIIVEVEPKVSWKYVISWLTDHFLVPWIFESKFYSPIFFRKSGEWRNLLEIEGFNCKVIQAEKNKPFTHVVFVCEKRN